MSAFYGCVQGNRGAATRGGSRSSGFKSTVQSYDGSVITCLTYSSEGELMVTIEVSDYSATYGTPIFYGTFKEFCEKLQS
jgi:hypothetical protein